MGVTNVKKQEELARGTEQVQSTTPYKGLAGVSENTAANLGNYQQGYQQSDAVTNAQNTLQQVQNNRPQGYTSKYTPALDNIMQQIQNPGQFKYEFNGDNLFKNYADLYTQKGKQASLDAMGQAAALTGGYGNSYAQGVGQQAYQQYLLSLYDKGLDLYDRAYQRYNDQLGQNKDIYNMLAAQEAQDYSRYRDTVGDWQNEEQQAYNRAQDAANTDYNRYVDTLNYYTNLANAENAQYNTDIDRAENIRQYEQNFAENQRQYDTNLAFNQAQFDWKKEADARDFAEGQRQYDTNMAFDQAQFDWKKDTNERDFAEQQRQYDTNLDFERQQYEQNFAENQRQYDTNMAFDRDQFDWKKDADARDFEEERRQYDQGMAYKYVQAIIANGQMPSDELLAMAGLSRADAQKMIAQATGGGGYGGGGSSKGSGNTVYVDIANDGTEKYYTFGADGHLREATSKEIKKSTIDTTLLEYANPQRQAQIAMQPLTLNAVSIPRQQNQIMNNVLNNNVLDKNKK